MFRYVLIVAFMAIAVSCSNSELGYDPKADPNEQLSLAAESATAEGKRILVIAGGDWCRWCHILNDYIYDTPTVKAKLDDAFVIVKVYFGDENYNESFFAKLPEAKGYPHFWIFSQEGKVIGSQNTAVLEQGGSYNEKRFTKFIDKWAIAENN